MNHLLERLRTVHGEVLLFGATFLGAIVLALVAIGLRERFFEVYVREKYPPLTDHDREWARSLAAGDPDPERSKGLLGRLADGEARERIYGGWIENPDLDPEQRLGRRIGSEQGNWLLERLRRTLVAGNPGQRGRALAWLSLLPERPETLELVCFARTRALHRQEWDLLQQADAVLDQLSPPHDGRGTDSPGSPQ
jgi:hypothetical protein